MLSLNDPRIIHGNGDVASHTAKRVIINGVFSQFEYDPFEFEDDIFDNGESDIVHNALENIHSCNLTDLCLYNQSLWLDDYKKLVASGMIKNLYFEDVSISDRDGYIVPLEVLTQNLLHLEKIR